MAPAASVLIPTRRRRDHLAVALAAAAPQAAAHGGELVVVEDDAADPATRALCETCGARYLALGAHRGLNVARTAAIEAAAGDLLCFLDDDAEPWPGWLGALLAGAARHPEWDVLGGPIRPRLEGARWPWCGREAPPVTALDLGPDDTEARFAWGANMAVRRTALALAGPFDPALSGLGDEEEWQRRLHAAGGRVGYVAAAGVDHRRAGADAGLRRLGARRPRPRPRGPPLGRRARCRPAGRRRAAPRRALPGARGAPPLRERPPPRRRCRGPPPRSRRRCRPAHVAPRRPAPCRTCRRGPADRGRPRRRRPVPPRAAVDPPTAGGPADPPYLSGVSGTLSRRGEVRGALLDLAADAASLRRRAAVARAARGNAAATAGARAVRRPPGAARARAGRGGGARRARATTSRSG